MEGQWETWSEKSPSELNQEQSAIIGMLQCRSLEHTNFMGSERTACYVVYLL